MAVAAGEGSAQGRHRFGLNPRIDTAGCRSDTCRADLEPGGS